MTASIEDIIFLSICAFLGNVGVALTGFGMAIIYLFFCQMLVLAGYETDFKYAIFIQALALFSAQPLLLKKAEVRENASWKMLRHFIPVTIVSTPIGQIIGDRISTELVEAIGGVPVTFVAVFEMYQKRRLFVKQIRKRLLCCCDATKQQEKGKDNADAVIDDEEKQLDPTDLNASSNIFSLDMVGFNNTTSDDTNSDDANVTSLKFADNYELGEELGSGAFSTVRTGTAESGSKYAIKLQDKSRILEEEEYRLKEEIALLREVEHENILCLHEVYDEPKNYCLVTDLMMGGDLLSRLDKVSFLPELEGRRIAKMVLDAVQYLHSCKIVHRDIKPENILLSSSEPNATAKLSDFGLAKREVHPDSFTTMCGTPAYIAPEILNQYCYGAKVDLWSFGVVVWAMLVGYHPFRGSNEQELCCAIKKGDYVFDTEFWKCVSDEAMSFVSSLLLVDPHARASAEVAKEHPWFTHRLDNFKAALAYEEDTKVFFMIGSQRSGSNWLRTMLDEREDLAGPHPPHVMRDFMPIIEKFGDLSSVDNCRILVDHVCTFVERNQVPWTDGHGTKFEFPRSDTCAMALLSCSRVISTSGGDKDFQQGLYLLGIVDAIYTFYAKANGKRVWLCKSMGMSKFHDLLLHFYGPRRLRYIYLVRDPRDVAMSFMKTPVGDCHWHAIVSKWTKLQHQALHISQECPELIHKLHYEDILVNKEEVVKGVYDFIGTRRFGGVKRQGSVLCMGKTEDLINGAKSGREAQKATRLSYQFQNLGRGPSFAQTQNKKWLHPETGLDPNEIQIIETVAHKIMLELGYPPHLVGTETEPAVWDEEDLARFKQLNEEGIEKMNENLAKENPADLERRQHQAAALKLKPTCLNETWEDMSWEPRSDSSEFSLDASCRSAMSSSLRQFLDEKERIQRTQITEGQSGDLSLSGHQVGLRWASVSQRGYYAEQHDKPNQDDHTFKLLNLTNGKGGSLASTAYWFSVYDGHGKDGHLCAKFARKEIPKKFQDLVASGAGVETAIEKSHLTVHERLVDAEGIETDLSGTTATTLLLCDNKCIISNVGDSTAVLGWRETSDSMMSAKQLCTEHTPKCIDEYNRIIRAGGLVMTADQHDGLVPINESWSLAGKDDTAPPRLWVSKSDKLPGCCFTRSIGDRVAHAIGVTARPELFEHQIRADQDRVLILASDGITEFMNNEEIVNIACACENPVEAAQELTREASERWLDQGDYMDDITCTVIFLDVDPSCPTAIIRRIESGGSLAALVEAEAGLEESLKDQKVVAANHMNRSEREQEPAPGSNDHEEDLPLGLSAQFWTLLAGAASGFLGGLCGIRGPPLIFYFLHPPYPVQFDKKTQRATGASITATNVAMRIVYYLFETLAMDGESFFVVEDWALYVCIVFFSLGGVLVGSAIFERMKDSRNNIRMILSIFLLLCGVSLLLSSFASGL